VTTDGRFLMTQRIVAESPADVPHPEITVNSFEELKRLVPVN
jgi:hypothetical protein